MTTIAILIILIILTVWLSRINSKMEVLIKDNAYLYYILEAHEQLLLKSLNLNPEAYGHTREEIDAMNAHFTSERG